MYDSTDPRAGLSTTATAVRPGDGIAAPEYHDFTELAPDEVSAAGTRTWITRGQNAVIAHVRPVAGDPLETTHLASEQVLILPHEDSAAEFRSADQSQVVRGPGLVIVPPGPSEIVPVDGGDLVRLVDTITPGWADRARNAESYAQPHPRVTRLQYWPEPVDGDRLRVYLLADVPDNPARFGRIFRTRAFMVNFLPANEGPRDRAKLSPHHHDDFEQYSLAVSGEFVHHIRTPWGTDADAWRDDEHRRVASPSVAIIPPPTVHTTEASGPQTNQLIDIFSPPRTDFSAKPGWVLNAEEYPQP
jgi:mannose-6-phosphate isomerase-like protein (cupin superfamily)